jgi:hypothetical protein
VLAALGLGLSQITICGNPFAYMPVYKGAVLFLLIRIATANYAWLRGRTS